MLLLDELLLLAVLVLLLLPPPLEPLEPLPLLPLLEEERVLETLLDGVEAVLPAPGTLLEDVEVEELDGVVARGRNVKPLVSARPRVSVPS